MLVGQHTDPPSVGALVDERVRASLPHRAAEWGDRRGVALHGLEGASVNLSVKFGIIDGDADEVGDATHLTCEILLEVGEVHHEDVGKVLGVPPGLHVVEERPEGPPVLLPRVLSPRRVEPLVEHGSDRLVALLALAGFLPGGELGADEAGGLVERAVPHLVAELVVVHERHERVTSVPSNVDVLLARVIVERIGRQVRLEEPAAGDGFDHALLDLTGRDAEVDPRRELTHRGGGFAVEQDLRDDLLHPRRARLVGGSNHDVVVPGFDDIPRSGVEVVGSVGLGLGPAGHVERREGYSDATGGVPRSRDYGITYVRSRHAFLPKFPKLQESKVWKTAISFHRAETPDPGKSVSSTSRTLLPRELPSNVP